MSDEPIPIDSDLPYPIACAWWTVAGIIDAAAEPLGYTIGHRRLTADGMQATIASAGDVYGQFFLTGDELKSALTIEPMPTVSAHMFWNKLISLLQRSAIQATVHRRRSWAATAEGAVEHYYRAKARNPRITLRDIAELTGFNYTYLSQVKSAYDKAGKHGSKPKTSPKHQT